MHDTRCGNASPLASPSGRRLVAVDIENVVGGAVISAQSVLWARRTIEGAIPPRYGDIVVLGTSHLGLLNVGCNWPAVRYVVRSGANGADLALLEVLQENVVNRFDEVILVSGDGIFAEAVASLCSQTVRVTVAAKRTSLSRRLHLAAAEVVLLDGPLNPGGALDLRGVA